MKEVSDEAFWTHEILNMTTLRIPSLIWPHYGCHPLYGQSRDAFHNIHPSKANIPPINSCNFFLLFKSYLCLSGRGFITSLLPLLGTFILNKIHFSKTQKHQHSACFQKSFKLSTPWLNPFPETKSDPISSCEMHTIGFFPGSDRNPLKLLWMTKIRRRFNLQKDFFLVNMTPSIGEGGMGRNEDDQIYYNFFILIDLPMVFLLNKKENIEHAFLYQEMLHQGCFHGTCMQGVTGGLFIFFFSFFSFGQSNFFHVFSFFFSWCLASALEKIASALPKALPMPLQKPGLCLRKGMAYDLTKECPMPWKRNGLYFPRQRQVELFLKKSGILKLSFCLLYSDGASCAVIVDGGQSNNRRRIWCI
ncbi:hypothetical protein VP01_4881g1 [Puccinia sorghi]|uniref:Uncharacterized protein n=1 Tax=Puccinia sorghi TaxID=27349 RepID=A0A0L6UM80_9BASI|nr:hypothetical protein VP01_4881g1 [Puccinia sorghi]